MRRPVFVAALLAASGCLPNRDNPYDSTQRPRAALSIGDWSDANGACPSVPPAEVTGGSGFPIGRCIVLDARDSADPQGSGGLRYRFELVSDDSEIALESDQAWAVLDDARKVGLELDVAHAFRVVVVDSRRAESSAEVSASFSNRPPTVVAGNDLTLPEGGFPWLPGADMSVQLVAHAEDPDAEGLEFCWATPDALPTCSTSTSFSLTVTSERQRVIASVIARDLVSESFPATQAVAVSPFNLWAGTSGAGPAVRVDSARTAVGPANLEFGGAAVWLESGPYLVEISDLGIDHELHVLSPPDFGSLDTVSTGEDSFLVHELLARGERGGRRVWAAGFAVIPGQRVQYEAAAWTISSGVLVPELPITLAAQDYYVTDFELNTHPIAVAASGGDVWITRTYGHDVFAFAPDGSTFEDLLSDEVNTTGISARPGSGEVWVSVTGGPAGGQVRRYANRSLVGVLDVPTAGIFAVGFADARRLWIATPEEGLLLIDADFFIAGCAAGLCDLEAAALVAFPSVLLPFDHGVFAVDPVRGTAWIPDGLSTVEARTDGILQTWPGRAIVSSFDDVAGAYFDLEDSQLRYSSRPVPSGALAVAPAPPTGLGTVDLQTGGFWSIIQTGADKGAVIEFDELGEALTTYGAVLLDGGADPIALPLLNEVRASPDGRRFWGRGERGLLSSEPTRLWSVRVRDEAGALPVPEAFRFETSVISNGDMDEVVAIEPLAPVNTTAGELAWVVYDLNGMDVKLLDPRTGVGTPFLSNGEAATDGSRSLYSNALCVGSTTAGTALLRRISLDGTVTSFPSLAGTFARTAAASDPAYDACWFLVGTEARAYSSAGVLLHSTTVSATGTILARSAHSLELDSNATIEVLEFAPTVGGALLRTTVVATGVGAALARP